MKTIKTAAILALVAIIIIGVGYALNQHKRNNSIKIGAIMILSGEGASWGEASRNGMEMAIADINKSGGVLGRPLEGVYEDDQSDPKTSVSAFNKLVSADNIKFVVGPNWSATGLPLVDLATQSKVVMISPSLGVADFNEGSEYIFNTWPHDALLSAQLGDYVYAQGHRHVALFGAQDPWVKAQTKAFTDEFTKKGGVVDMTYEPTTDTKDVRTEVAKVVADKKIDAVVMTTDGYSLTDINAEQLREGGVKVPFYNITTDNKIIADCGTSCEGMIFPTFLTPTKTFSDEYKAKYNRDVEIGADSAYDAVMMLAQAMEATKSTDPDAVKVYLSNIKTYQGASGTLTSDGKRAFTKPYILKEVKSGVAVTIPN